MSNDDMPKAYDPKEFEERLYRRWLDGGYFSPAEENGREPFVVVIPPPNVTGILHMGHGLNNSLQDIITRYKRMQGFPTLWMPGTDHAGIATQHVMERELKTRGTNKHKLGREEFIKETWKLKERHHDVIINQLKRMGCGCDWARERFTLDEGLSKAVRESFALLYERGLIYRGERLVNWCSSCGTAIADDEMEYGDEEGALYHITYALSDGSGALIVATTRPETLFGDMAVAVNPQDERYTDKIGKTLKLPLTDREIPVIADPHVDKTFGTGCLKVTPGHSQDDFEIGARHNLPVVNILDPNGSLNDNVPEAFRGLRLDKARKAAVEALERAGLLVKTDKLNHRVGRCYRCNTAIEPFLSKQWFVRMAPLAEKALKAWENGEVVFYPKRWENTYKNWLTSIRDWCISRQLWWGHRIPVWYCDDCGETSVSRVDLVACPACKSKHIRQDEDVLDTWFSSWLWPFSTMGWPEKTPDLARFYPTDTLITAYDIIFFWVARMIMAGLEFMGEVPFKDVYITPLVRDKQGRKMSKSLGNGIDPLEVVDEYGADALRFTIAYLSSQGQDLPLDKESFKLGSKFCNKIWNASRYLLTCGVEYKAGSARSNLDRWIYGKLNDAINAVERAVTEYRFDDMGHAVYEYFWNDFCDWYVEGNKPSLYGDDLNERTRAVSVAYDVLEESLRLLHPFVPFITEEIYSKLPNKKYESLVTADAPKIDASRADPSITEAFGVLQEIVTSSRALRGELGIPAEKKARMALMFDADFTSISAIKEREGLLISLIKLSEITYIDNPSQAEGAGSVQGRGFTGFIFAKDFVNKEENEARLKKELLAAENMREASLKKLSNPNFVERAKPEAVEKERERVREAEQIMEKIKKLPGGSGS